MEVKILLDKGARIPEKAHEDDFCYDVWATSEEEIAPGVWKYGTGLHFQIMNDILEFGSKANFSIDLRPRSSIWKTGMILSNSIGTIDENYRGEVSAVFYHVVPNMPRYKVGDRIGQIKLGYAEGIKFLEVKRLSETDRGSGAYGSTGK